MKKIYLYFVPLLLMLNACHEHMGEKPSNYESRLVNETNQSFKLNLFKYNEKYTELVDTLTHFYATGETKVFVLRHVIEPSPFVLRSYLEYDSAQFLFADGKELNISCRRYFSFQLQGSDFWRTWNKSPFNHYAYDVYQTKPHFYSSTFVFTDSLYFLAK